MEEKGFDKISSVPLAWVLWAFLVEHTALFLYLDFAPSAIILLCGPLLGITIAVSVSAARKSKR